MRRVAGGVRNLEGPAARFHSIALADDGEIRFGYRCDLAPQALHVRSVQARRAGNQLSWIDDVRRPALVHEYLQVGVLPDQRACCTRMIEMYVREQQMRHVGQPRAALLEARFERVEAWARSGIDERQRSCALNDACRDRVRTSEKIEIDP